MTRPAIERALRHIGEHLDEPLSVADVARVAHLSEYHFHRVFSAEVGEPVGRFITRRRLEVAALRLAYAPERSITEIALESGYSSPSNFTTAFGEYFGCSPSAVRQGVREPAIGRLTRLHGKDFAPADLYTLPSPIDPEARRQRAAALEVRFETSEGRAFACLASPAGYAFHALERTWADLIAHARALGLVGEEVDAWGIAHDSPALTAPEHIRYHACVPVDPEADLPAPLFPGRMPAGRYAVFPYTGPVDGVEERYRTLYSCWFPESVLSPEDFVPFDHYVGDEPVGGHVVMEMWIRVRAR